MSRLFGAIRTLGQRLTLWIRGRHAFAGSSRIDLTPNSTDPIVIQFSHDVNKASRLLDFLIEEGHPYHVPGEIIDKIEAARSSVNQDTPPTSSDRADLLKAYRDLVTIPGTAVLFDFPPTPFWHSGWRAGFILVAIIVPLISFLLFSVFDSNGLHWYLLLGLSAAAALTTWALYVFTGIVTNLKLNHIISFCYLFTVLVLVGSIAPWWVPDLFSPQADTPAGILRACAAAANANDVPPGVTCRDNAVKAGSGTPTNANSASANSDRYQWVLNIGGVAERYEPTDKAQQQGGNAVQKPQESKVAPIYMIRGGLVVPLYVIILSLIGGAVSMTRRVPEYQRRAMSAQDPFTNQQARESLVFQIMQVASAPLIAITAYYIVNPSTNLTSVVLGFGSGFASEPILLMIRGLVEKLSPGGSAPPAAVTVRVDPPNKDLEPGKSHQFTAHVSGASSVDVSWLIVPSDAGSISQSGYYTAPADEGKTVTVTACSVADRTKCGSASVTIKRPPPDKPAK